MMNNLRAEYPLFDFVEVVDRKKIKAAYAKSIPNESGDVGHGYYQLWAERPKGRKPVCYVCDISIVEELWTT